MLYVHFSQFINHKILPLFLIISSSFSWAYTHTHTHTHTSVHACDLWSLHAAKSGLLCWGKRQKTVHCSFNIYLRYLIFMGLLYAVMGGLQTLGLCAEMQCAAYRPPLFPNVCAYCLSSLCHPRFDARFPSLI